MKRRGPRKVGGRSEPRPLGSDSWVMETIQDSLRGHLKRLHELELEARDRRGYLAQPQREEEHRIWEDAAAWPERISMGIESVHVPKTPFNAFMLPGPEVTLSSPGVLLMRAIVLCRHGRGRSVVGADVLDPRGADRVVQVHCAAARHQKDVLRPPLPG